MPECLVCKPIRLLLKVSLVAIVGIIVVGTTAEVFSRLPETPTPFDRMPVAGCFGACLLYASSMLMFVEQGLQAYFRVIARLAR